MRAGGGAIDIFGGAATSSFISCTICSAASARPRASSTPRATLAMTAALREAPLPGTRTCALTKSLHAFALARKRGPAGPGFCSTPALRRRVNICRRFSAVSSCRLANEAQSSAHSRHKVEGPSVGPVATQHAVKWRHKPQYPHRSHGVAIR